MQAADEFVLVRSVDNDFEIQIRTKPWHNSTRASIISAVALKINGQRFGIYLSPDGTRHCLLDGVPQSNDLGTLILNDGDVIAQSGNQFEILWLDGTSVKISANTGFLSLFFRLLPNRFNLVEGLLGNANGDKNDDLQSITGTVFEPRLPFGVFYDQFVEGWRVTDVSSLFDYEDGETTATYTDRSLPTSILSLQDFSDEERANAFEVCKNAGVCPNSAQMDACMLDVALTGEASFAQSSAWSGHTEGSVSLYPDVDIDNTFEFGNGRPFTGSVETACGIMTLVSTNTEPYRNTSFRDLLNGDEAEIRLTFEKPVRSFHLKVNYIRADEYLDGFNIPPTVLSGTLMREGSRVTTNLAFPSDRGSGIISWHDINTTSLSFVLGGPAGTALAVEGYTMECEP